MQSKISLFFWKFKIFLGDYRVRFYLLPIFPQKELLLTWLESMLLVIYWSKRKRLHKKRVQLHDFYGRRFIETLIETLPSDNGDANENVAVKMTLCVVWNIFRPKTKTPSYLKGVKLGWNWREGPVSEIRDGQKYIAWPLSFPSQLKIWSFHVVVV